MPNTTVQRNLFVESICRKAAVLDPRIADAFRRVERERFLGEGPWFISASGDLSPTSDPRFVYQDIVIAISQQQGITNGLPSLHARCIGALSPARGERVVHIGAGSGYYSAVLAELVGPEGEVAAFEIDNDLAIRAQEHLRAWSNVRLHAASGVTEPLGLADGIYVNAGVSDLPLHWLSALKPDGRLVFPLVSGAAEGAMWKVSKLDDGFEARSIAPARFYPCIGAQNNDTELLAAYRTGRAESVRSLRLDEPISEFCWYRGHGWWLSTQAVST